MANSTTFKFLEIPPIAHENKYSGNFSYFVMKLYIVLYSLESPHRGDSNECTQHTMNVQSLCRKSKKKITTFYRYLIPDRPGSIISPGWFGPPMSRTNFHGSKMFEPLRYECWRYPFYLKLYIRKYENYCVDSPYYLKVYFG